MTTATSSGPTQPVPRFPTPVQTWPGSANTPTPSSPSFTQEQIQSYRNQFIEMLMQQVVLALKGMLEPGNAFNQLASWGEALNVPFVSDLFEMLGELDFTSPEAFFQSLADVLMNLAAGLLGIDSPLNSQLLYNIIPQNVLGSMPFSHVGVGVPNLLANPKFESAVSVQGSGLWLWDDTQGVSTPGNAYTTAVGAERKLISNAIPVSEGQKLDMSIHTKWAGLAYTGIDPIQVQVVRLLNYVQVGTDDLFTGTTPGADQTTWVKAQAVYTTPNGCDMVCMQLRVADTASAGTVRFDEGDVHKIGSDRAFVPFGNVLGVGGPANIGESVMSTWDEIISGLVGNRGVGSGLPDLFPVNYDVSSWASKGRMSFDILGIRNNKSLNTGFLPTSESTIGLDTLALRSTPPVFGITQSTAITGYRRIDEAVDKGVVSWQGYGITNVTDCYINIYKMNTTTGVNDRVHASTNQVGLLSGGSVPVPVIYPLPSTLHVEPGEVYGLEVAIRGAGTHYIVGEVSWLQDQAVYPRRYSSVRNSGTSAAPSSFTPTYGTNVPFIELGVSAGTVEIPHSATPINLSTVGAASTPIPDWVNFVDVIAVGSGGGAYLGAAYGVSGEGGFAGSWSHGTWSRGTHFSGATSVSTTVPAGGLGYNDDHANTNGASAVASIPGYSVTATGGAKGVGQTGSQTGKSPGNHAYNDVTYVGGGVQNTGSAAGVAPGGGGCGGDGYWGEPGGAGGRGGVWLVMRQT